MLLPAVSLHNSTLFQGSAKQAEIVERHQIARNIDFSKLMELHIYKNCLVYDQNSWGGRGGGWGGGSSEGCLK